MNILKCKLSLREQNDGTWVIHAHNEQYHEYSTAIAFALSRAEAEMIVNEIKDCQTRIECRLRSQFDLRDAQKKDTI